MVQEALNLGASGLRRERQGPQSTYRLQWKRFLRAGSLSAMDGRATILRIQAPDLSQIIRQPRAPR